MSARAVAALQLPAARRRAELISPHHVLWNPITREVLAGLLTRVRRDSPAGWELQKMAYRADPDGVDPRDCWVQF